MKNFDKEEVQRKLDEYACNKSIDTRNEIVLLCSVLVDSIASKYASMDKTLDINELKSYGFEGLILGVETYNKELGNFVNYFSECIKNIIRSGIEKLKGYQQTYYWDFMYYRRPIEKKIGKYLEFDPEILNLLLEKMITNKYFTDTKCKYLRNIFNINTCYSTDDISTTIDTDSAIEKMMIINDIRKALNSLDEKDRKIIMLRFGFVNNRIYTLRELEEFYSITHEGIRFIEKRSFKKLKKELGNNYL